MHYLIELRDSDGNDCSVYDLIIKAKDKDAALDKAWRWVKRTWRKDEEDGGYGTFHPCDCVCEHRKRSVCDKCREMWECSHGGVLLDENVEEYATHDEAKDAHAVYHTLIEL